MPRTPTWSSSLVPVFVVGLALGVCLHPAVADGSPGQVSDPHRSGVTYIPPPRIPEAQPQSERWVARLERWTAAVYGHARGVDDAALTSAAGLSPADLRGIAEDLAAVRTRLVAALKQSPPAADIRHRGDIVNVTTLLRLFRVSEADATTGSLNALVKRGAALHGDVAILQPRVLTQAVGRAHSTVLLEDGQHVGYDTRGVHWHMARSLLDLVMPSPGGDPDVHRWYVAVGALSRRQYDYDLSHLDRARALFPDDPDLLFLSGCLHEALAAPRVQGFVSLAPSGAYNIGSAGRELADAERFLRRAVELAPSRPEPRLRLARVLTIRNRAAEAIDVLASPDGTNASSSSEDATLQYFRAMFLGDAHQRAGQRREARASYESAAALFPRAQSPYLALAQLARSEPDRAGAVEALERLFARPGMAELMPDPWWDYYGGTTDTTVALVKAVQMAFDGGAQ